MPTYYGLLKSLRIRLTSDCELYKCGTALYEEAVSANTHSNADMSGIICNIMHIIGLAQQAVGPCCIEGTQARASRFYHAERLCSRRRALLPELISARRLIGHAWTCLHTNPLDFSYLLFLSSSTVQELLESTDF
jgi:hypothetical protein